MSAILQPSTRLLDRLPQPRLRVVRGTVPTLGAPAFTVLVMAIFVGSLLSSLFINVALTQGAFEEAMLTREVRNIEAQQQSAQQTLAMLGSPGTLESRARAMGMVPAAAPVFIRLSDGKVIGASEPAERSEQPAAIEALMPQSSLLDPELPMAAAAHKSVPAEPRTDAAVELAGTAQ